MPEEGAVTLLLLLVAAAAVIHDGVPLDTDIAAATALDVHRQHLATQQEAERAAAKGQEAKSVGPVSLAKYVAWLQVEKTMAKAAAASAEVLQDEEEDAEVANGADECCTT